MPPDAADGVANTVTFEDAAAVFRGCVDLRDDVKFAIVAATSRHDRSHPGLVFSRSNSLAPGDSSVVTSNSYRITVISLLSHEIRRR